ARPAVLRGGAAPAGGPVPRPPWSARPGGAGTVLDRDPDRLPGPELRLVGAVRDQLGTERAPCLGDLVGPPLPHLGGPLAHPPQLCPHLLQPLPEPEDS